MKKSKLINTWRTRFSILFVLVLSISAIGCGGKDNGKDNAAKLATVGDKIVTANEFDAYLKFKRLSNNKRQAHLSRYLEREQLAQAIEKSDSLDKNLIQAELNEFKKEMLISRYFEQYLKDKVTDQAVQNYYSVHAKDYEQRKVHVAHILFRTDRTMGEAERAAKLTAAQEAYSKVSAGQPFAEVAKNYSEDTVSGKKGGDLGWLKDGAIDARFSQKVFTIKPGQVSEPFETAFGFHIVTVLEGPSVVKRPFEAVKGDIRYQLRNEAKDAELKRLLSLVEIKQ